MPCDARSRIMIRRNLRPWLAAVVVALAASPIAGAADPTDPSFEMTVSQTQVHLPGTTALEYRLRIATGAQPERFQVDVVPPRFQTRAGSSAIVRSEGATIAPAAPVELAGAGKLTPIGDVKALIGCTPSTALAPHGHEPSFPTMLVEVPAHTVSTLVARYRAGDVALWPGADLRLTMRIGPGSPRYGPITLDTPRVVRSPAVAITGRTATRLELWTKPAISPAVVRRPRRLSAGSLLDVRGSATKVRAGRRVSLWMLRHGKTDKPRMIGTARSDAAGRLRLRTRVPTRSGEYELWSRTPGENGGRAGHSCPIAFRVGG